MQTYEQTLQHEMQVWGEDYIADLLDRGYELKLTPELGKWVWIAPIRELTLKH